MPNKRKLSHTAFLIIEVILFYVLARLGRTWLDALLVPLDLAPALLTAARIGFVVLIVVFAYFVDRALFRFMTAKGWLE